MTLSSLLGHSRIFSITSLLCIFSGFVAGCASDAEQRADYDMIVVDKKSDRQTVVEFNGACARALADSGEIHIGDSRYVLTFEGKTYYFENAEGKKKFEENVVKNVNQAQEHWINRGTNIV